VVSGRRCLLLSIQVQYVPIYIEKYTCMQVRYHNTLASFLCYTNPFGCPSILTGSHLFGVLISFDFFPYSPSPILIIELIMRRKQTKKCGSGRQKCERQKNGGKLSPSRGSRYPQEFGYLARYQGAHQAGRTRTRVRPPANLHSREPRICLARGIIIFFLYVTSIYTVFQQGQVGGVPRS
jgi:hypothetical protein